METSACKRRRYLLPEEGVDNIGEKMDKGPLGWCVKLFVCYTAAFVVWVCWVWGT